MDIILKKMDTDEEVRGKAYVHWRSWQETYPGIASQQYLDALSLEKYEVTAFRWRDDVVIAKHGDDVIGFASYGRCRDDDIDSCGEVYAVYVLAAYHGQGVGHRLMEEAASQLREYRRLAVWVAQGNERAIRFYERFGFRFDGKERSLQLGMPVTVMRMVLDRG